MFNCGRQLLPATALACLFLASGASANPLNTFTAAVLPSHVKPSVSVSHTITMTNDPLSPARAQKATIGIPPGFTVDPVTVQATTTAVAGLCDASTWEADGVLIEAEKIQLRRPGADANALCPGATLTVVFSATSAPSDGTYAWTSELLHEVDGAFTLTGVHPTEVVDGTPPEATITQKPPDPSNADSPSFVFTAGEPSSFECKLDGAAFEPCGSPRGYTGLADGAHTFAVRATDTAGNSGLETSYAWTIDTTVPTIELGLKPSSPSNDTSPSIAFSAGEPSTFECSLDAAAFAPCVSPTGYSGLADGAHTFEVRPTDAAGNTGGAATFQWTIDTAAPTVAITTKPPNPTNSTSPSFEFAPSEAADVVCQLDGGPFTPCASPRSYSGLADGAHTFAVKATDLAGNAGAEASHAWTIDTTAPVAAITSKPANPTNNTSSSFAFTANGPADFQCKLDAALFAPCASPKSYAGLAEGEHTFVVKATDTAGNTGSETSYAWTIDTTAPTAVITEQPASLSKSSAATFAFTAGESGGSFACKLDIGPFAQCSSPQSLADLPDGSHIFTVTATDVAGNTGTGTSYAWVIDTAAPTAAITEKPSNPSNGSAPSFTFAAGEPGSTFSCRLDGAVFAVCVSPMSYTALGDGSHTFEVRATDPAGNTGSVAAYTWTIDTVAPTVAITAKPSNPSGEKSASLGFTAGESAAFQCKLDTASFASCASPTLYADLAEGGHTFVVRGTDAAGNTSEEMAFAWTVDTIPPAATITQKPANPSNTSFPTFAFGASETGSTLVCKLDGAAFTPCNSPKSYTNLAEISHTFVVKATDTAGNTGSEASYTWTIDTTPPTASITAHPANPSNEQAPTFAFTADESTSTFSCKLDGGAFELCATPKSYSGLADGVHTFTVRATDAAGTIGASVGYGWTIDTTAPIVAITQGPSDPTKNQAASFAFSAGDATAFECSLDGAAFAPCTSPRNYTDLSEGSHTFAVRATDALGNAGLATHYAWKIDITPPTAAITVKPSDPSNDSTPSFSFTASEPGSSYACRLEGGGFAPCASPKDYSGLADGPHSFGVRATDAAGNIGLEASFAWTVDTVAPTATITLMPAALSNTKSPSFTFTASESDGTFDCRLDAAAFAPCASPSAYPGLAEGPHTFVVRATDTAGNTGAQRSYSWTIDTIAPTVAIAIKPGNPSNEKSPAFTFTASESAQLHCKLDGAAFTPCSSPKSYADLADGDHAFVVRATDLAQNTGPETGYTWTVDTVAPTTAITAKPGDPSKSASPSFSYTASEPAAFQCKLDAAAFAACLSPKSYAGLAQGAHTFAVKATDVAGNAGSMAGYAWTIDTTAPTAAITAKPSNPSNSASPSFSFTASESGSTFVCRLDAAPFSPCASPAGYGSLGDGSHAFGVKAVDPAGNTGPEASYGWTIETRAPTAFLTSAPSSLSNSSAATFAFSADEPSSFDCKVDGRGFEPCSSPATHHGLGDGGHAFTVRAKDAVGNLSAPVAHSWTIDTIPPETTITSAPKRGTSTTATFAFSASESGIFECRLDGAPFALCASPRNYSALGRAEHRFEVRAVDAAGNADPTPSGHAWTVEAATRAASSSALLTPRTGARVTRPPLLVWRRAARASYYNVQLFRGKQKVLSVWPPRARLQLRARWRFDGRQRRLARGTYRWYVWPAYGSPSARRYGALLGQSSFVVVRTPT